MDSGLEALPDDILIELFRQQTDLRSIMALALVSKRICDVFKRSRLIRILNMPDSRPRHAITPENKQVVQSFLQNEHLCTMCWMCTAFFPVELEAIEVVHKCGTGYTLMYTNIYSFVYRGDVSHLPSPLPATEHLNMLGIPIPTVPPYNTIKC
jgi:hypothetical protein